MARCPRCNTDFPDDVRFCPEDGVQLSLEGRDPHVGRVLLKQFEIREVCGRGSMGTVYRAWQGSMQRNVAVKILRDDLVRDIRVVKRFHREARAAARLSHPNIISVFLVSDGDEGPPFMVMEFVTGQSLDTLCQQGPLPPIRAIHIARQIAAGLVEAHGNQIVHRDLKPENILLSDRPQNPDFVKVLDFGIAKILHSSDEPLTQTGAIFGTPHYLSPEQASGAEIDQRCDLYALGVILYRMTTGRLPFDSDTGMEVLLKHIREQPPTPRSILPRIPRRLEQVILRCMAKNPAERYPSGEAVVDALDEVVEDLQSVTPHPEAASTQQPTLPASNPISGIEVQERLARDSAPDAAPYAAEGASHQAPLPGSSGALPVEQPEPQVGSTTVGLAHGLTGRRSLLKHLAFSLAAILGGGAVGALAHYRRKNRQEIAPPPQADAGPAESAPTPDAAPAEPDAAAPAPAKKVKKKRKPRPRRRTRKPRRTAPTPTGAHSDDHGEAEVRPLPTPPAPEPSPTPRADPYDLVD